MRRGHRDGERVTASPVSLNTYAKMTKQHFIALADSLRSHNAKGDHVNPFREDQIEALADFCAAQNPAFNRNRWLAYVAGDCGPNGGKLKR